MRLANFWRAYIGNVTWRVPITSKPHLLMPQGLRVYEAEAVQSYADGEKIWVNVMQCANDDEALEQAKQWGGP
jgi:hypothetical protein